MKKLLLSSLMMFAVCGYITAQDATGSKFQKAGTTSSTAPTPQKAAVVMNDVNTDVKSASDKEAHKAATAPAKTKAPEAKAVTVTADGVVVPGNDLSPKEKEELKGGEELRKMEAAKAAAAKKNN